MTGETLSISFKLVIPMPKTVNIHKEEIRGRKEKTHTGRAGPCSDRNIAWVQSGPHRTQCHWQCHKWQYRLRSGWTLTWVSRIAGRQAKPKVSSPKKLVKLVSFALQTSNFQAIPTAQTHSSKLRRFSQSFTILTVPWETFLAVFNFPK